MTLSKEERSKIMTKTAQKLAKEKYDKTHKMVDGILYKQCNKHDKFFPDENDWLPCTTEYFYINKTNKSDGLKPHCKECDKKKTVEWQHNPKNRESFLATNIKMNQKPEKQIQMKVLNRQRREDGKYKEWQENNRDKTREYSKKRGHNKLHKINKKQWKSCLEYFDNQCAYCGMTLDEHKTIFKQQLHREHVDHEGANDLSNCIPSCKTCNSSKHLYVMEEWYNKQPFFSKDRLERIYKWLNEDYKLYIKDKRKYERRN